MYVVQFFVKIHKRSACSEEKWQLSEAHQHASAAWQQSCAICARRRG